ncbi:hypothetical protein [Rhodopirellula sp. P2]|uniref:hypothetical protein n=1 Tax=Rhodopirellula sp. P2 TaxID=2127060 RepID=UPI002368C9AF|nr:hypothetical protein [Rhodopirellula sp. P2]WDQ19088.1 hypothetical protein PSR62_11235 [Rhodopirellula sp. P2]
MKKRLGQESFGKQSLPEAACRCGRVVPAMALALVATSAIAQPPVDDWKKLELPTVERPVVPPSDRAAEKIQKALEGDAPVPTGDGMLDDVLNIIQRRGSVLDGSVLDSEIDPLSDPADQRSKVSGPGTKDVGSLSGPAASFRLAEQLLATARRLEKAIPSRKAERTPRIVTGEDLAKPPAEMLPVESLVYQLRLRAVELMQSGLQASRE